MSNVGYRSHHEKKVNMKLTLGLFLLMYSLGNAQWERVPEVPANRTVYSLYAVHDTLYVGTDSLVYVGANGGTQWFSGTAPSAGHGLVSTLLKYNGVLIAGMFQTGFFKSTDEGASWQGFSNGLSGLGATDISDLVVRRDSLITGTLGAGVFTTSADLAHPWSPIGDSLASYQGENVFKIGLAGNTILAGGGANGYMFRYTDTQPWWNPIALNTPRRVGQSVSGMSSNATTVVAATTTGVYRSTNEGLTWEITALSIPLMTFQISLRFDGATVYALSTTPLSSSLFISPDEGKTWNTVGVYPLPNIFDIAIVGDTLYLGGTGGLQRAPLSRLLTSVQATRTTPHAFQLGQNFPNPFNPTTTIQFEITREDNVSLMVYNSLGQEVATLVNERLAPGRYQRIFGEKGMTSGVYFYRLKSGTFESVRKSVLVK